MVTRESAINTARSFINDCKTTGLTFHKVFLFGSTAKNRTHEWSDYEGNDFIKEISKESIEILP